MGVTLAGSLRHPRVFLPAGELVRITDHACDRFMERVLPSVIDRTEARDLIREAIHAGDWVTRRPRWVRARAGEVALGWFVFEDLAFPVVKVPGEICVVTVVTEAMRPSSMPSRKARGPSRNGRRKAKNHV